ncbi:MAG: DNA cytosine methyltransferase [Bacteroidota bacterium]|nr:DNA cytosine methyltransferase [Bacteroidota bacterium]
MANKKTRHLLVDLFAGCGGLSTGMENAGFTPWFVNEIVPQYCDTYRANHQLPDGHCYVGDINKLNSNIKDYKSILKDIDLVCGGPPCQGFSTANRQRIIDDPRNGLYRAYLQFLQHVRPKFFVMENVVGMANKLAEIKEDFLKYLGDEYAFDAKVLQTQNYGVPQNRRRLIFIGNRMGVDPADIFAEIEKQRRDPFVLRDVLEGLPPLQVKEPKGKAGIENYESGLTVRDFKYKRNAFYRFINGERVISKLYNHKNRYNNPRDVEIFRRLPQGADSTHESIADIMPYTRRKEIFKDKYFKLEEGKICKTITSHMKYDCNMYIHPWEARGLSPREAARIQTFPDDYVFQGAQNSWYAQIGNAVPVKLAEVIGNAIMKFL